jgi:hypothetical protein
MATNADVAATKAYTVRHRLGIGPACGAWQIAAPDQ